MRILITGGSGFIGTNFHEYFFEQNNDVHIINVDLVPPKKEFGNSVWERCDIMDAKKLEEVFRKHNPDCVIHLAAETSCEPELTLKDYKVNTDGSKNVFDVSSLVKSVKSVIHTSTQFINQTDFPLKDFFDYKPHTIYGESKVISEKILTENKYDFDWVIIRPTNVWGKWHLRYPQEFWKVLSSGKYIHPDKKNVVRSYGYVGNICYQVNYFIENISTVKNEVFYVGDEPILLYKWVNAFSNSLNGRNVRKIPKQMIYCLALAGNILKALGIKFPITISRYRSMTLSNPAPMDKTLKLIGKNGFTLEEGVKITSDWLKSEVYTK